MGTIYVGVGEFTVSNSPGEVVKTLALGSCVAVVLYSVEQPLLGLLHVALPESAINVKLAQQKPGMFADTGILALMAEMKTKGSMSRGRVIVKLAGGASIMDPNQMFNIGKRNVLAIRKVLWSLHLGALAEDVGENYCRSVAVEVNTGRVLLSSPGRGEWEL